jgi:Ca2+-transporting ATPase
MAAVILTVSIGDYTDAAVIAMVIVVNTTVGVVQEVRADRAVTALASLSAPLARVIRDGRQQEIAAADVVPGDALVLAEGDLVAADADLTESAALLVDESSVTGESVPVERPSNLLIKQPTSTWRRALLSYGDGESTAATVTGANSTIAGWLRCSTDTSGARALEQGRAAARFGTIDPAHCRYVLITL